MPNQLEVLTVGHSNHILEAFINLLLANRVTAVADVRSAPFSRLHPQFNRDALAEELKNEGIAYSFLGNELGGRPKDKSCYEGGQVQYRRVAKTGEFGRGLDRILTGAQQYRIALMCAEREPLECHRGLLIAPELENRRVSVVHIHADGTLESHAQAMDRLLTLFGLSGEDLFRSRSELVEEACLRQQERVAYAETPPSPEGARAAR